MGVLERVSQMRSQGMGDSDIVNSLRQEGISPREINDALNQAHIKNAVSDEYYQGGSEEGLPLPSLEENQAGSHDQYEDYSSQERGYGQDAYQQEFYGGGNTYEGYSQMPSGGYDTGSLIEISEQVFSEKISETQKQIDEVIEFKALAQAKIDNLSERLRRIETMIDKLQISILEEVGSYGKNLDNIKKEMSMMQDSFGKMINPLADLVSNGSGKREEGRGSKEEGDEKHSRKKSVKKR